MSHENASFGNIAPGQRFYDGQLSLRGVPWRPGGFPGVQRMPPGVPRMPSGVPRMPAGVPRMPAGVPWMPAGVPRKPAGVPRMPARVPGMEGSVPGMPGGITGKPGGVLGRPSDVIPGNMGQYIFSGDSGITKAAIAPCSKLVTGLASRSSGVPSLLPSRGGSYGGNVGSSFTSRGSLMIRGQGHAGMYKRGGIRMTRGGAVPKRGFGMLTRGGARMSAAGVVPSGGRGVVRGGIGTSGGAGIGQVGTIDTARNGTRMYTQDLAGMARKDGMGMGTGGLKFSGGTGMSKDGGGFKRAIEMTRDGGYTGGVEMTKDGKGFTGDKRMTRGVGGFTGSMRGVGGIIGSTRGVGGFAGSTRGVGGIIGSMRGVGGFTGSTRGVGGFTGSRVMTRGGGRCNGVREKQGNSTENMTGAIPHHKKITPDVTTTNRVIEVIDLDQTIDMTEEKPTIKDQKVDQEPLSDENIRDLYYGGLKNFGEKGYDVNGNKIGNKRLMKATVKPYITVSIVTEKSKNQETERSVTHDKVKTDNNIKESGKLNANYTKKEDDVKINMEEVDVLDHSIATSIRKSIENKNIFNKPACEDYAHTAKLCSFIKTVDTVSADDVMKVSDNKIGSNIVMFENAVESNALQNEKDWADIDAVKVIIEGAGQKPLYVNGEEILFDCNIDVTEIDQNFDHNLTQEVGNKSEYYCRETQKNQEINSTIKGNSENKDVLFVDKKRPKCRNEMIKWKLPDQIEASKIKDKVAIPKMKNRSINDQKLNISPGGDFLKTYDNSFKVDPQSWKEKAENRPKSQYEMEPLKMKKCCINVKKMNISPDNFMEVDGVNVSFKVDKPEDIDSKKKSCVKNRTNKSWVWKYLTPEPEVADMAISGGRSVICNLCSKSLKYKIGQMKALYSHLRFCHPNDIEPNERNDSNNCWMIRYGIPNTDSGNMESSGSIAERRRYICKLCSKKVPVSHFLKDFKQIHRHKLKLL